MELQKRLRYSFVFGSIALLAACSSADSVTAPVTPPATPTAVTLSGSIFASDVGGASVTIKKTDGTTVAGPVTTNSDGTYSIDILDTQLVSDLVFESTGGGFVDEETRLNATAGSMSAFVSGGTLAAGDSVHVTPSTTIHAGLIINHGKTPTEAQTAFFNAFAYNPDFSVDPVDITDPASLNAGDVARLAGWHAAVFSRLASDLGLTPEQMFEMFAAIAQDLSDGDLDGDVEVGSTGVNTPALATYIATTGSFNTAEAANLEITYTQLTDEHGKNVFKLTILDTSGGGAATPVTDLVPGTELTVMPMMYMADRIHATPMGSITELGNGEYEVTAYYLMPSRMPSETMGTWDLKVMVNMKSVHFYPNIDMAPMINTARVQLKGIADTIFNMDGLEVPRPYNLFRDNLAQNGMGSTYDFDVYIAPMETMMSFPALVDGMILTSGMGGTDYNVSGITVEASIDGGTTWDTGTTGVTAGVWSFTALNLDDTPGFTNEIRVKLTVSGETKTDGGLATDPDFQTFNVTF